MEHFTLLDHEETKYIRDNECVSVGKQRITGKDREG